MKIGRYTGIGYSQRTSSEKQPSAESAPKKKALLIGISYPESNGSGYAPLKRAHRDVALMRNLLVNRYGYALGDVVTLLDSHDSLQPTRTNILRAIVDLVRGARRGDRFFFHYCGYTIQVEHRSNSEEDGIDEWLVQEDGMDECLVPADGEEHMITDDELRRHLIDPLPVGAALVAVFDSCHSASLLDLAHFRCNRVYAPWVSKARRRIDERWNAVVRQHALPLLPLVSTGFPAHTPPAPRPASRPRKLPPGRSLLSNASMTTGAVVPDDKPLPGIEENPSGDRAGSQPPAESNSLSDNTVPPLITTRRIYEAARTSARRVHAWRTEVDALEVATGPAADGGEAAAPGAPEETEVELSLKRLIHAQEKLNSGRERRTTWRASLPLTLSSMSRRASARTVSTETETGRARETEEMQRRTKVRRALAVSVAVRPNTDEAIARTSSRASGTGKENVGAGASQSSFKLMGPYVHGPQRLRTPSQEGEPLSWLTEEGEEGANSRTCESPAPLDASGRGYEAEVQESSISLELASSRDDQISWGDADGGRMTRELVRILERDSHPTLRALVTDLSKAMHRMQHLEGWRYKGKLKEYSPSSIQHPRPRVAMQQPITSRAEESPATLQSFDSPEPSFSSLSPKSHFPIIYTSVPPSADPSLSTVMLPIRPPDVRTLQTELTAGGVIVSVHSPRSAVAWVEAHYHDPLLEQLRSRGFDGPMAVQLSTTESALAIFGSIADALVPEIARVLVDISGFAVMVRSAVDNPMLSFFPKPKSTTGKGGPGEHRASRLRGGAADPTDDDDEEENRTTPKWEGKYHNATVDLRLKVNDSTAYDVNISSYIKASRERYGLPDIKLKQTSQKTTTVTGGGTVGLTVAGPTLAANAGYTRGGAETLECADEKPMPKCHLRHDIGKSWDTEEAEKIGKDFRSYDISWLPGHDRDNVAHEMRVEFGLGMYMRQNKRHKPGLPPISAVLRNQIVIWVYDPDLHSKVRGLMLLTSTYIPNALTDESLTIHERTTADLNARWTDDPPVSGRDEEPYDAAMSVSVAALDKSKRKRTPNILRKLVSRFSSKASADATSPLPMHETVSRGWDATNMRWRNVCWPTLDQDFRRVHEKSGSAAWKLRWYTDTLDANNTTAGAIAPPKNTIPIVSVSGPDSATNSNAPPGMSPTSTITTDPSLYDTDKSQEARTLASTAGGESISILYPTSLGYFL
ncbi:caspase domain-containing protein [Mycena epipterygia]|nr:caspase domain-containing protein [Mycena epipterygia]